MFSRFGFTDGVYYQHADSWLPSLITVEAHFGDFSGTVPEIDLSEIWYNSSPILCSQCAW